MGLTREEFKKQYGGADGLTYDFWYGQAVPKGAPTWVHGLLQATLIRLLAEADFIAAPEVELRIDPEARPKPDVVQRGQSSPADISDSSGTSYPQVRKTCGK